MMKLQIFELWMYVQVPLLWWLFRRFARRDVTGEMLAGIMVGAFNEFATQPLWDYHLSLTIYKDTPLCVVLGWGVMGILVVYASEWLYRRVFRAEPDGLRDKRILLCDMAAAAVIAFPIETIAMKMGIWDYRFDLLGWTWGEVPFFGMPYEALAGYCLLMLFTPSFIRLWKRPPLGGPDGR